MTRKQGDAEALRQLESYYSTYNVSTTTDGDSAAGLLRIAAGLRKIAERLGDAAASAYLARAAEFEAIAAEEDDFIRRAMLRPDDEEAQMFAEIARQAAGPRENPGRKPLDKDLYADVVAEAKERFDVWPSAYASGWVVKTYKARGGRYGGESKGSRTGLTKWFGESWVDLSRPIREDGEVVGYEPCGRKRSGDPADYPKCRPAREAMRMTPAEVRDAIKRKRAAEAKAANDVRRLVAEQPRRNPRVEDAPGSAIAELGKKYGHRFMWSSRKANELVKGQKIRLTARDAEPTVWQIITHPKPVVFRHEDVIWCNIKSLHDGTVRKHEWWYPSEEVYVDV